MLLSFLAVGVESTFVFVIVVPRAIFTRLTFPPIVSKQRGKLGLLFTSFNKFSLAFQHIIWGGVRGYSTRVMVCNSWHRQCDPRIEGREGLDIIEFHVVSQTMDVIALLDSHLK